MLASSALLLFLPFLLLQKGVDSYWLGLYAAAFFVGNFAGKTLIGRFVDTYGSKNIFIGSELCMAILVFILVFVQQPLLLFVLSILLGAFTLGTVPAIQTMISETADVHGHYEKSYALNSLIGSIGMTIAPLLLGIISDSYTVAFAFYAMALFALIAVIPAAALHIIKKRVTIGR